MFSHRCAYISYFTTEGNSSNQIVESEAISFIMLLWNIWLFMDLPSKHILRIPQKKYLSNLFTHSNNSKIKRLNETANYHTQILELAMCQCCQEEEQLCHWDLRNKNGSELIAMATLQCLPSYCSLILNLRSSGIKCGNVL